MRFWISLDLRNFGFKHKTGVRFFGFSEKNEDRKRPKKSKKYPHELDWKLTRAMINLIGLEEGETLCDPFCGTGTTLIESESMGINAIGIDFDEKMCEISKENLKINNYKSKILKSDFQELVKISKEFDGIVTDLPYGRSSKALNTLLDSKMPAAISSSSALNMSTNSVMSAPTMKQSLADVTTRPFTSSLPCRD